MLVAATAGDLPPWATVYDYFAAWTADGTVHRIHDRLREAVWDDAGRDPMASGGWLTPSRSRAPPPSVQAGRGYDAGKINGRKPHIVVDTLGCYWRYWSPQPECKTATGGARVLDWAKMAMPSLALVFADGGYAGRLVVWARRVLRIVVDIVRKPDEQRGFAVLPRRWVVERLLSWLTAHRRLARDYEPLPEHSEAWVQWSMIGLMTRRLAPRTRPQTLAMITSPTRSQPGRTKPPLS